jgi:uncharacterized membrane protein (UPF0127 family)
MKKAFLSVAAVFFSLFPVLSCAGTALKQERNIEKIMILRGHEEIATFSVEVVSGMMEIQQGLSGRSSMLQGNGMLFILDSTEEHFFWMKGMEFPIDILFFDKSGALSEVLAGLQACDNCLTYAAPPDTAFALEVNAGTAGLLGITKGDRIVFVSKPVH